MEKSEEMRSLHLLYGLPLELFRTIQEYLIKSEYISFMNTTKLFRSIKRHTLVLDLNRDHSIKYYKYTYFRRRIAETLNQFPKQLCVRYFLNETITDLTFFENVYKLNLYRCPRVHNFSALGKSNELSSCLLSYLVFQGIFTPCDSSESQH